MSPLDVLIVNPPSPDGHIYIRDVCRWGRRSRERMMWPQTSLAYLAAMVPSDMSVEIIDAIAEEMTWAHFESRVRERHPRLYVSYLTGTTFEIDARGIALAKGLGALTIAIGTHPSAVPKDTLDRVPALDVVIRHEPELTFRDVVDRVRSGEPLDGCAGTAIRVDGRVIVHEDRPLLRNLDDLPIPQQHLLPLDRYRMPFIGSRYVWVLTNRGCPYRCTYCFEGVVWGKSVRYRSADSIVQELEYLASHGVHKVVFLADLFTYDRRGVMRLCDLILEKGLNVQWACNSRVDTIDKDMALHMKRAGCWLVALGIESGAQAVLDAVKKDTVVAKAAETVSMLESIGLRTLGYFIIGLPGETVATIRETIDFAKSLPLDIALFHVAVPYAGTDFYFQAVANGWLDTGDWSQFDMNDSAVLSYPGLPAETILAETKRAFREFYLRPAQAWRFLRMTAAAGDLRMLWDILNGFRRWLLGTAEDRIAARCPPTCGPPHAHISGSWPHTTTIIERPRSDPRNDKLAHRAYRRILDP